MILRDWLASIRQLLVFLKGWRKKQPTRRRQQALSFRPPYEILETRQLLSGQPVADPGGPYTLTIGNSLSLSGTQSTDPDGLSLTYQWDLNGDGTNDFSGSAPSLAWSQLAGLGLHTGTYTLNLTVSDSNGGSNTASTNLTVNEVPPSLTLYGGMNAVSDGQSFSVSGYYSEPTPGNGALVIDWGMARRPRSRLAGERLTLILMPATVTPGCSRTPPTSCRRP